MLGAVERGKRVQMQDLSKDSAVGRPQRSRLSFSKEHLAVGRASARAHRRSDQQENGQEVRREYRGVAQ